MAVKSSLPFLCLGEMVSLEFHDMADAWWRLFFDVSDVDECFVWLFAKPFDDIESVAFVLSVEAV